MMSGKRFKNCIGFVLLTACGALLTGYLICTDYQPSGGDIWGHLYKSQQMYESIKQGDLFPIFSPEWYNGIQLFRYWGPLSYYVMAALQFVTGGDLISAYRLLAFAVFTTGGIPWIIWGNISGRRVMGTLFGLAWFFIPENIRIYFTAGNLPQMLTTSMVPYMVLCVWLYVRRERCKAAAGLYAVMVLMSFTHLMVTAIMGVATFLYLMADQIWNRCLKRKLSALAYMLAGIMTAGIWVVPALSGGLVNSEAGDGSVMSTLIYPLSTSLNPFARLSETSDVYYFGLAAVIVSVPGLILADKNKAGYVLLLVLLVFTTPAAYNILVKLPFSQLFWMTRFTPMIYGYFFASCMEWTTLKRKYCAVLAAVLLVDILPCLNIEFYTVETSEEVVEDMQILSDMTTQRTAVIDLSSYGSYPSYGISGANDVMYTYGWSWQGAVTGDNIVLLNEALEREYFLYLFDRAVSLGDDTVLLRKSDVEKCETSFDEICTAAEISGYEMAAETTTGYIFRLDTTGSFGVVTKYRGIAIGAYANEMTLLYPSFTVGESDVIEDYTVSELCSYDVIFLTGFECNARETAEQLIREVAKSGTRVVIDAAHLPSDPKNKQQIFLGVLAQTIHFDDRYPVLSYEGQESISEPFAEEDADFSTMYITGTDSSLGTFDISNRELTFLGTKDDAPNVYFLGLNIMYEAVSTKDPALVAILDDILTVSTDELPERETVPVSVTYTDDGLTVDVTGVSADTLTESGVNTTIAYQDIFVTGQRIGSSENLLTVYEAHTEIEYKYPLFAAGLAVSLIGLCACAVLGFVNMKNSGHTVKNLRKIETRN